MPDKLKDVFDDRFGIGPGNQYIAGDLKLEIEERRFAGQVGDGFLLAGPLDQLPAGRQVLFGQFPFVIGVKLDPCDAQNMGQN